MPGEHHIKFGIRIPCEIKAGSFQHSSEKISAQILYRLEAKLIEGDESIKASINLKICNHFEHMTIQKILYDETSVSSFLCFGGGVTNLEVEFVRDTFCINGAKL